MNAPLTPQDWELLSAYLDGQLPAAERSRVSELLERRADLQSALEALRRTRQVLRAAPRRRAPRNFTLTPALARQVRPPSLWSRISLPSFSLASALATILLVLSFFFQPTGMNALQAVPMMASAPGAVADQAQPEAQPTASPIINWQEGARNGGPTAASGMGGGPVPSAPTQAPRLAAEATRPMLTLAQPDLTETPAAKAAPNAPPAATALPEDDAATTTGPILGIAPTEERGQVIVPTQLETVTSYNVVARPEPEWEWRWEWTQAGLALTALLCGGIAWILWRKARRG